MPTGIERQFANAHGDHYRITRKLRQGVSRRAEHGTRQGGQPALAFEGQDLRRPGHPSVCIKLLDAEEADEATTDLEATTRLESELVNGPLAVERFGGGIAVISRLVPGITLDEAKRRLAAVPAAHATVLRDELFFRFLPRLCEAVQILHDQDLPHGDLHGDNVMVQRSADVSSRAAHHYQPVIVDLGMSRESRTQDLHARASRDLESTRETALSLALGTFWEREVTTYLRTCETIREIAVAVNEARRLLGSLACPSPARFTRDLFRERLRLAALLGPVRHERHIELCESVAVRLSFEAAFLQALGEHERRFFDRDYVRFDAEEAEAGPVPPGFSYDMLLAG